MRHGQRLSTLFLRGGPKGEIARRMRTIVKDFDETLCERLMLALDKVAVAEARGLVKLVV